MNAQQVKELLNSQDMFDLLVELGGEPRFVNDLIYSKTICHTGKKHKLIYYPNTRQFTCFTDCNCNYDVFSLVGKVFGLDFPTAFRYICGKFRINADANFLSSDRVDTTFIKKFAKKESIKIEELDKNLLNNFYKLYHREWVNDGISIQTMKKFNILFSINENKIIIPHFDFEGRLIGIRGRTLNQEEINKGRKYMPVFVGGQVRKHPTGANIFGLNVTKNLISQYKTIILFESEKGPMQLDTMIPDLSIGGGISGSFLSYEQIKIMQKIGVENVILAMDKEWQNENEEKFYKQKIKASMIDKLLPFFNVYVIWDKENLLPFKAAPTDMGKDIFLNLWKNKIKI